MLTSCNPRRRVEPGRNPTTIREHIGLSLVCVRVCFVVILLVGLLDGWLEEKKNRHTIHFGFRVVRRREEGVFGSVCSEHIRVCFVW